MKKSCAYQFELLLFLLLITFNPTLSGGIVSRGVPFLFRIGRIVKYFERVHKRHKTTPDKIVNEFPPPKLTPPPSTPPPLTPPELTPPPSTPPPSTPPELTPPPLTPPPLTQPPLTPSQQENQIEGLFLIKQFLYEFGYLQQRSGSTSFDDTFDEETKAAIDVYQNKFNLQVTGDLNKETLQQILLPRCGVPDINFEYNMSDTNYSWPKGIEWFPKGTKNLTYAFAPESEIPLKAIKVFKSAFTRWSTTTKLLNFTETSSYVDANIKIGFYSYDDMFDDVVVGDTFISLQSSAKSGVVRLDNSMIWILPTYNHTWSWQYGEIYLESVVMHQIGHLLGLDHSFEKDSIMYPTILPSQQQQRKVEITNSDNQTIHQLYSNAIEVSPNSGSSLPTALFLGFALMALLN